MSQSWYSTFERWTDHKHVEKLKEVIQRFTKRTQTKDARLIMSQLPHESMTSLYNSSQSEEVRNSFNASKNTSLVSNAPEIALVEDQATHKTQVSINLDSISDSEVDIIETENFKVKIWKDTDSQNTGDPNMVKVKIILPKGSLYTLSDDKKSEETPASPKENFKQEDFTVLSEKFLAFANSMIDVGSTDFTVENLTCSSPIPFLDEAEQETEEFLFLDAISKLEEKQDKGDLINNTLNNTVEMPNNKGTKPMEFINNVSMDSFEMYFTAPEKYFQSLEELAENFTLDYLKDDKSLYDKDKSSSDVFIDGAENLQQIKNISAKSQHDYYDDLKKKQFYNRNLKNTNSDISSDLCNATRHSIDTCDYKHVDPIRLSVRNVKHDHDMNALFNSRSSMSNPANYRPIMGRTALLTKSNLIKEQQSSTKTDSEIIEQLVRDRFNDFLTEYYRRSIKRRSLLRRGGFTENEEDEIFNGENIEDIAEINTVRNKIEYSIDSINQTNVNMQCIIKENQREESHLHRSVSMSDGGFISGGSSSRIVREPEIYLSPASSTTCNSRNFGEFIESGLFDSVSKLETRADYDSQKFLREALGDDVDLSTTFYEEPFDEPYSAYRFDTKRTISEDYSIGTSEVSALISGPSIYSTLSEMRAKNIPITIDGAIEEEESGFLQSSYLTDTKPKDEFISDLIKESAVQFQIIQQTSKALNFCKSIKEFQSSLEQIEAEKILLTATCQREVILREIKKIRDEEHVEQIGHQGSVRLGNFIFQSRKNTTDSKRNKEYTEWYVCVVNCGTVLFATDAVTADFEGNVCFNSEIFFDKLSPDFEITIAIYAMKVKNNLRNYSHESKYHLNKHSKSKCPSPNKLLTFRRRTATRLPDASLNPSSFIIWGNATIKIGDLRKSSSLQMRFVPTCSVLSGEFSVTLKSSVEIKERYGGFLNVGNQANSDLICWNRLWCSLYDTELRFWNDPAERGIPVQIVHLRSCLNSWISAVDRSFCARPKTLLLETANDANQIIKHFLNADTIDDMKKWESLLNSIVSSLRMWQCMKCHLVTDCDETSL